MGNYGKVWATMVKPKWNSEKPQGAVESSTDTKTKTGTE